MHKEVYLMYCDDLRGKEIQKKGIYVYILLIHFTVQQKVTQHWKAAISQLKNKTQWTTLPS